MNFSFSTIQSPDANSAPGEMTPTAMRLLPMGLLSSPSDKELLSVEISPKPNGNNRKVSSPIPVLQLTTKSGIPVAIHDPKLAEQLILSPIRASLLSGLGSWYEDLESEKNLKELIRLRNLMSKAFEEYVNVFCCTPCCHNKKDRFYLDYVCEAAKDSDERLQMIRILRLAQEIFSGRNKYIQSLHHHLRADEDFLEDLPANGFGARTGMISPEKFERIWTNTPLTPNKCTENSLISEFDFPVLSNQCWSHETNYSKVGLFVVNNTLLFTMKTL